MKSLDVKELLAREINQHRTPSVCYTFFDINAPLYEIHMGMVDIKNQHAATPESVYPIYSVTKTFTALAVLQLEELGLIDLEHPASKYVNDFPYHREITIKQLLSHSSGIPNPFPLNWIHLAKEHDAFDTRAFFSKVFVQNKMKSRPGNKFRHSNLGYVLLGKLIEDVTNMPYTRFITDNIFKKLSLNENDIPRGRW